jgi:Negative regulator of sigma F
MTQHAPLPKRFERATPAPGLYARLHAQIEATPASRMATSRRVAAALMVVPALSAIAVAVASQIVYGAQAVGLTYGIHSSSSILRALMGLVALTVVATFVATRSGHGFGAGVTQLVMTAALATPAYAALTFADALHSTDIGGPSGVVLSGWAYRCLILAALVGALALAAFTLASRRAVAAGAKVRGAALGAAAGLWSGLAVFVFCPSANGGHLMIGHVLPILAFTVLGAVAIPRFLRP